MERALWRFTTITGQLAWWIQCSDTLPRIVLVRQQKATNHHPKQSEYIKVLRIKSSMSQCLIKLLAAYRWKVPSPRLPSTRTSACWSRQNSTIRSPGCPPLQHIISCEICWCGVFILLCSRDLWLLRCTLAFRLRFSACWLTIFAASSSIRYA